MSEILSKVRRWKPERMVLISRFVYQRRILWENAFCSSSSHPIYSWEMEWENTLSFANTLILFLAVNKQDVEYKCHGRTANKNRVMVLNSKWMTGTKLPKPCLFNFWNLPVCRQNLLSGSSAAQMLEQRTSQSLLPLGFLQTLWRMWSMSTVVLHLNKWGWGRSLPLVQNNIFLWEEGMEIG